MCSRNFLTELAWTKMAKPSTVDYARQAAEISREAGIASLKHTQGDVLRALHNELASWRLDTGLLDHVVWEYAAFRRARFVLLPTAVHYSFTVLAATIDCNRNASWLAPSQLRSLIDVALHRQGTVASQRRPGSHTARQPQWRRQQHRGHGCRHGQRPGQGANCQGRRQ